MSGDMTWRQGIADEMQDKADPGPVLACTLSDADLNREFDSGYGGTAGAPFTAWTETRVYFPIQYDGAEWVGSVPRNPCGEASRHKGGG